MPKLAMAALVPLAIMAAPVLAQETSGGTATAALQNVLNSESRAEDRARDQYRHPVETLAFFQVEPGQTVIDYMPDGGWYSRVLIPYLGPQGRYIGLNPDPASTSSEGFANYVSGLSTKFPAQLAEWNLAGANAVGRNTNELGEDMNGTVDRVLIIRGLHNLHRRDALHDELTRLHSLLAEDGMLGIVQHRAKPWAPASYTDGNRGYMRQQDVIGLIEAHGFDLVATSEINANPRDTADHPGGVWEIAPSFSTKRQAELGAIGESDRMTLLFRKRR